MIDFYQGQWMYILQLQIMKENNNSVTELNCRFCSGECLSYSLPKNWTPLAWKFNCMQNCRFKYVHLTELNCRLCSFSLGYMCGVQCTEDPKKWITNVSLEISFVFTSLFSEHLGKQHREVFCWLLLRSFMMKNRR